MAALLLLLTVFLAMLVRKPLTPRTVILAHGASRRSVTAPAVWGSSPQVECTAIGKGASQCVPAHCSGLLSRSSQTAPLSFRVVDVVGGLRMAVHPPGDLVSDSIERLRVPYCPTGVVTQLEQAQAAHQRLHFLDVGANIGSCSLLAASLGHHAFALEPTPANVALIRESLALNDFAAVGGSYTLFPLAAANASASLAVFSEKNNAGNSVVIDTSKPGATKLLTALGSFGKEAVFELPQDICTVRVDALAASDARLRAISLLKVDVQGHEAAAFHGMHHLLGANVATAFVEVWPLAIKGKGSQFTCESIGDIATDAGLNILLENPGDNIAAHMTFARMCLEHLGAFDVVLTRTLQSVRVGL